VAEWVAARLPAGAGVLSLTKGLDPATGRRLSEAWAERLPPGTPFCVLSGPTHAEEVVAGQPTAAVVAGDTDLGRRVQELLTDRRFRVYLNDDLVGVELCGAAKNVIAVAAGMSDGLGLGDNAKASLITRGLAEMTRLGLASGARAETFRGLAGMGDLVATCTSRHSRNRRAGELIAQGVGADEVEARIGQVAEGLPTAANLLALAARAGVELPISAEVAAAFAGRPVAACLESLMARPAAEE
jgi:glycerol-3-phosphate dehydrogenase (NAD(P)+)